MLKLMSFSTAKMAMKKLTAFLLAKKDPNIQAVLLNSSRPFFCSAIDLSLLIGNNKKQVAEEITLTINKKILDARQSWPIIQSSCSIHTSQNLGAHALSNYLDPKNDVAFRRIFGSEANVDILIHFLNHIMELTGGREVQHIQFLNPIWDPDISFEKQSIVDVLCRDSNGKQFVIVMAVVNVNDTGFGKRVQSYAAKAYSRQNYNFKDIRFIALANCILFENKDSFITKYSIRDEKSNENDLQDFHFVFIELPKFRKQKHQLSSKIDKWIYFFKNARFTSEDEMIKVIGTDKIIQKAHKELNRINWNEKELLAYEQEKSIFERKFDEGVEDSRVECAKKMLAKGLAVDEISELSGLEKEKVLDLIKLN